MSNQLVYQAVRSGYLRGVSAPAVSAAPEIRQWMAVVTFRVYDPEFDRDLDQDYSFGPYPVVTGPGEPCRAEYMARVNLPDGHTLQRWYPQADPMEFCEF